MLHHFILYVVMCIGVSSGEVFSAKDRVLKKMFNLKLK
jgi:hypothetical protein